MSIEGVFQRIISALDKAGVPYMLSGSFASAYYGAPRSTQDIDLVIETTLERLKEFVKSLAPARYYVDLDAALEAYRRSSLFNVIDLSSGWKIDFIIRKPRPFSREEFSRRVRADMHGLSIFVASAEDIVIAKLEWSKLSQSQRQIEDVAAILKVRSQDLDRSYIEKWTQELEVEAQWKRALEAAGS
jgi:hypothetical protein